VYRVPKQSDKPGTCIYGGRVDHRSVSSSKAVRHKTGIEPSRLYTESRTPQPRAQSCVSNVLRRAASLTISESVTISVTEYYTVCRYSFQFRPPSPKMKGFLHTVYCSIRNGFKTASYWHTQTQACMHSPCEQQHQHIPLTHAIRRKLPACMPACTVPGVARYRTVERV
jgi:hypothetical protein